MTPRWLQSFLGGKKEQAAGPVTCLGKTFADDQARRDYFLALLAEKLKDHFLLMVSHTEVNALKNIKHCLMQSPQY